MHISLNAGWCSNFVVHACLFIHAYCCWCVRSHGVRTVKWGTAQNGSERLFLREKRLSNAQARGLCEANAGYAPRRVVCWWRGIVQLWHWREIRALAQALLWEKGASKVYIAISNSILFLGIRRGNTKKVQRDWSQHFRRLVPDTLPDNIVNLVYKVTELGVLVSQNWAYACSNSRFSNLPTAENRPHRTLI